MKEYRTINKIAGPLVFVEKTEPIAYGELVHIILSDGSTKRGQVLDTSDELVVVQIFENTTGIGRDSGVRFTGETMIAVSVSPERPSRCLWVVKCSAVSCQVAASPSMAGRRLFRKNASISTVLQ